MPIYGALILILQVACAVHAIKTGRPYWWLFIILLFPVVGCLIYFFVEIFPDLGHGGRRAARKVAKALDPNLDLKQRSLDLALSDTVENKMKLAEECLNTGRYGDAVELYTSCLAGVYKDDPHAMLGLARAYFAQQRYDDVKLALDRLIEINPDFKSPDGHMLYARALEALGKLEEALEEYKVLAGYYPGLEGKCRYGVLLSKLGKHGEARKVLDEIMLGAKRFARHYRGDQQQWVDMARQTLSELPS